MLCTVKPSGEGLIALPCRCLDGGANSKPTQYATWALANLLVDNPAAQVLPLRADRHPRSPLMREYLGCPAAFAVMFRAPSPEV